MLARQTKLQCVKENGIGFTTCWLEVDRRVEVGTVITLRDDPTLWTVVSQSEPMEAGKLHTDWDVGGLESTRAKQLGKKK